MAELLPLQSIQLAELVEISPLMVSGLMYQSLSDLVHQLTSHFPL